MLTGTIAETITSSVSAITSIATTCLEWVMANEVLSIVFVGGTLMSLGFKFLHKSKRVAK